MRNVLLGFFLLNIFCSLAQSKIGVVDSGRVLDTMPSRRIELNDIERTRQDAIKELTEMDSVLHTYYSIYMNPHGFSCSDGGASRRDFQNKIKDFESKMFERENQIDEELDALIKELEEKSEETVRKAVEIVSVRLKLDVVLYKKQVIRSSESLDITNAVILEMLKLDAALIQH